MRKSKPKRTITRRWVFNNFGMVLVTVLIIELAFVFIIQNYYYTSVRQYLTSRLNTAASVVNMQSPDSAGSFSARMQTMLETFDEKDRIEVMAIDAKGRVILTSSGFSPDSSDPMPDCDDAVRSGSGYFMGRLKSGEKIMAVSVMIHSAEREGGVMRMVVSLTAIDGAIRTYVTVALCIGGFMLLIMVFTGLYFVASIVRPIQQISSISKKFATGDFKVRIAHEQGDEIGELCTAINYMADELSHTENMKNEFISSISHELRTPLTAIKGWAETLANEDNTEMLRKGLNVIGGESERLAQMVEELLDFSRMQSGHFTLQSGKMDILAELEDAVLIYSEKARREGIEIICNTPESVGSVFGDKNRIRQVFINIIDNAIKYSSEGGTVTVNAEDIGGTVRITVADRGCGIKDSDLPKIKTKFYKANHSKRGSGIGLAVADEIVTLHNGSIDIKSREGHGTTVTVTLPTIKKK